MQIATISTRPLAGQRPGTSGLRQKVAVFRRPHYLENFIQATFNALGGVAGKSLVLGGDGRYFNPEALQTIIRLAAGNGVQRLLIGQGGLLSTPAASHLIRKYRLDGGFILSASHNPGGPEGDFGIKFNIANGGPAPEHLTAAIAEESLKLTSYRIAELPEIDLSRIGESRRDGLVLAVIDPVADYADLLAGLFDFAAIARLLAAPGFAFRFDAMAAVTGPYAREIFVNRLGAAPESLLNATPKPDFGGGHPDPNLQYAAGLVAEMFGPQPPAFGAASDGDGDRNMILGANFFVTPSDSLAVLAANLHLLKGYSQGLKGVARSMPTSRALDAVAAALGIESFETPTGWKFFGNLLDAGRITLCGEESFGTGSDHVREKDGLWAVLAWLNLLAVKQESVAAIVRKHWRRFGRHYYTRHDYEEIETAIADRIIAATYERLRRLNGAEYGGRRVILADDFAYRDPVDGRLSEHQGLRLLFADGGRIVIRRSGTGTAGATLRLYFEQPESDPARLEGDPQQVLARLIELAEELTGLRRLSGRPGPTVIT
jgi:phosphoglucomutase